MIYCVYGIVMYCVLCIVYMISGNIVHYQPGILTVCVLVRGRGVTGGSPVDSEAHDRLGHDCVHRHVHDSV